MVLKESYVAERVKTSFRVTCWNFEPKTENEAKRTKNLLYPSNLPIFHLS